MVGDTCGSLKGFDQSQQKVGTQLDCRLQMGTLSRENLGTTAIPPGVKLIRRLWRKEISFDAYKTSVLILTFIAYALYHASRKPTSIVKNVLDSETSSNLLQPSSNVVPFPWPLHKVFIRRPEAIQFSSSALNNATGSSSNVTQLLRKGTTGWAPFDGASGRALLGEVDVAFLAFYSFGMYFAGHLGDRVCLRWFLAAGMIGSGICVSLFGMAYWWNVHWIGYFFIVQMVAGLFQATGWPSVVTVVANWFGKRKRGLIMGIWNAHTSVGNICGSLIASAVLNYGWGWSFVVPGITMAGGGILIFLFLAVDPVIVGLPSPHGKIEDKIQTSKQMEEEASGDEERGFTEAGAKATADLKRELVEEDERTQPLLRDVNGSDGKVEAYSSQSNAVGFLQAWAIPGVAPFAFCLFFAKLVAYTFLYWLPFYIRHTEIRGEYLSDTTSGNLSTIFDVGGILGGILAGHLSDRMNARATTAASFMYGAIPALLLYRIYGSESLWLNVFLLFLVGMFVNGPYALITTAVSADLGTHKSLKGNSRALATVTAIIDGTGSVGAALGPLITGYISTKGWNSVFTMLVVSASISGLLLTRLVVAEVKENTNRLKCLSIERLRQVDLAGR